MHFAEVTVSWQISEVWVKSYGATLVWQVLDMTGTQPEPCLNIKTVFLCMDFRCKHQMDNGIPIPVRRHLYIEMGPSTQKIHWYWKSYDFLIPRMGHLSVKLTNKIVVFLCLLEKWERRLKKESHMYKSGWKLQSKFGWILFQSKIEKKEKIALVENWLKIKI